MRRLKNKKILVIAIFLLTIVSVSMGYSLLSRTLKINGSSDIKQNTWDIHFNNVSERCYSIQADTPAYIVDDKKTIINFAVNLTKPGQIYSFDADIVNEGTINAMIESVEMQGFPEELSGIFTWDVKYLSGDSIEPCDELLHESSRKIRVTVKYDENVDENNAPETQTINLSLIINYVQLNNNTCVVKPATPDPTDDPICAEHTLTINPNGGIYDGKTDNTIVMLRLNDTYDVLVPTRDDYNFTGWTVSETGVYENNKVTMGENNVVMTANWVEAANNDRTISIDPNGGTYKGNPGITVENVVVGDEYNIVDPVWEDHEFLGWIVTPAETYDEENDIITVDEENITTVAEWKDLRKTISIDPNGGTYKGNADVTVENVLIGDEYSIADPIREGFEFIGWTVTPVDTYDDETDTITVGEENVTAVAEWEEIPKLMLTIDPNEGIYNGDTSATIVLMDTDDTYTMLEATYDGFEFDYWEVSEDGVYNEETGIVTMGTQNITMIAHWKDTNVPVDSVARIKRVYYPTIQEAFDDAIEDDVIHMLKSTTESPTNNTNASITLDLEKFTVTGTMTNNGDLTLLNGSLVSEDNVGFVNNGILTMGKNDYSVLVDDYVDITGSDRALEQNGTFNFYDGYLEATLGLDGIANKLPTDYVVFIDRNEIKDCQKVYPATFSDRAVAKSELNGITILYYNLQDAFDYAMKYDMKLYGVRNFDAPYALHTNENKTVEIDLDGIKVNAGQGMTNNGTFIVSNGTLSLAEEFTNNGSAKLYSTIQSSNFVNNGEIDIDGGHISSVLTNNVDTELTCKNIGLYSASHGIVNNAELTINNCQFYDVTNNGKFILNGGGVRTIINSDDGEFIAESGHFSNVENGSFTMNGGEMEYEAFESYGIKNANTVINDGVIKIVDDCNLNDVCAYAFVYGVYGGTFEMNGGEFNVVTSYGTATGISSDVTGSINGGTFNVLSRDEYYDNWYTPTVQSFKNIPDIIAIDGNSGLSIKGGNIKSSGICVTGNPVINGGSFDCTYLGINARNQNAVTITGGTINTKYYYGVYGSKINMTGGSINSESDCGAYLLPSGSFISASSDANPEDYPYISGNTSGICTSNIEVGKAKVEGKTEYGIYDSAVALTDNEDTIDVSYPLVTGFSYAISNGNSQSKKIYYYDGVLKGQAGLIDALRYDLYPNSKIVKSTEMINESEYQVGHLVIVENFLRVGSEEFNSLLDAYDAVSDGGTIEVIADAEISSPLTLQEGKSFTLDFNGHVIELNSTITNNTELILNDSSEQGNGGFYGNVATLVNGEGLLTINGGKYDGVSTLFNVVNDININGGLFTIHDDEKYPVVYMIRFESNLSIKDARFVVNLPNKDFVGVSYYNGLSARPHYVTIDDSYIDMTAKSSSVAGNVTLNDSVVHVTADNGVIFSGLTMNSGEVKAMALNEADDLVVSASSVINGGTIESDEFCFQSDLTINGGNIKCYSDVLTRSSEVHINGGNIVSTNGGFYNSKYKNFFQGIYNFNFGIFDGTVPVENYPVINVKNTAFNLIGNGRVNYQKGSINFDKVIFESQGEYLINADDVNLIINLGVDDGEVDPDYPMLKNSGNGAKIVKTAFNYYDGTIISTGTPIDGLLTGLPSGYTSVVNEKTIDGVNYNYSSLEPLGNFLRVGSNEYSSYEDAIDAVSDGGTIELLKTAPVTSDIVFPAGKNIIFELGGNTLNIYNSITIEGTVEFKDTVGGGGLSASTIKDMFINNGSLTITNCNVSGVTRLINSTGPVELNGGNYDVVSGLGVVKAINNTSSTSINGGKYMVVDSTMPPSYYQHSDYASSIIIGGPIDINDADFYIESVYESATGFASDTISFVNSNLEINANYSGFGLTERGDVDSNIIADNSTITINSKYYGIGADADKITVSSGSIINIDLVNNDNKGNVAGLTSRDITVDGASINVIIDGGTAYGVSSLGVATINNLSINSNDICLFNNGNTTVSNSDFECSNYAIQGYNNSVTTVNSGNYVSDVNTLYIWSASLNVVGGTFKSLGTSPIYLNTSKDVVIGSKGDGVSTEQPYIIGDTGIYVERYYDLVGDIYYYDGVILGTDKPIDGIFKELETDYYIFSEDRTIDETVYHAIYLKPRGYVLLNTRTNESYKDLDVAFANSSLGDTLKLLDNFYTFEETTIPDTADVTIDLNGYEMGVYGSIITNGNVKIVDTVGSSNIVAFVDNSFVVNGKLIVAGIDCNYADYYGTMFVNDGVLSFANSSITSNSNAVISNGELHVNDTVINAKNYNIKDSGKSVYDGLTIEGDGSYGIYYDNATDESIITNSNISAQHAIYDLGIDHEITISNLDVTGQIYNSGVMSVSESNGENANFVNLGTLTISGSSFDYTWTQKLVYGNTYNVNGIDNSGILNFNNSSYTVFSDPVHPDTKRETYVYTTGINNRDNGSISIKNSSIDVSDNHFAAYAFIVSETLAVKNDTANDLAIEESTINSTIVSKGNVNAIANESVNIVMTDNGGLLNGSDNVSITASIYGEGNVMENNTNATIVLNDGSLVSNSNQYAKLSSLAGTITSSSDDIGMAEIAGLLDLDGGRIYSDVCEGLIINNGGVVNIVDTDITSLGSAYPPKNCYGVDIKRGGTLNLGIRDGSGDENADIISTPTITGKDAAVKNYGTFNYYDGTLVGYKNVYEGTITNVEDNYEATFYYDRNNDYYYSVLEYASSESPFVVEANNTKYTSLQYALNKNVSPIKLLKDINEDVIIESNDYYSDVVIDLNGHVLNGQMVNNKNNGTYSVILKNGKIINPDGTAIINNGRLVIGVDDSTIDDNYVVIVGDDYGIQNNGLMSMYDGTIAGHDGAYTGIVSTFKDGYDAVISDVDIDDVSYVGARVGEHVGFAEVDGVVYNTLYDAIYSVNGGDPVSVKLVNDGRTSKYFQTQGRIVNIDLNGHALIISSSFDNTRELYITDSSDDRSGKIISYNSIYTYGKIGVDVSEVEVYNSFIQSSSSSSYTEVSGANFVGKPASGYVLSLYNGKVTNCNFEISGENLYGAIYSSSGTVEVDNINVNADVSGMAIGVYVGALSTVNNINIDLTSQKGEVTGLKLYGSAKISDNVHIKIRGNGASTGIYGYAPLTLSNSSFDIVGTSGYGLRNSSSVSVSDTTVNVVTSGEVYGVYTSSGQVDLNNVTIDLEGCGSLTAVGSSGAANVVDTIIHAVSSHKTYNCYGINSYGGIDVKNSDIYVKGGGVWGINGTGTIDNTTVKVEKLDIDYEVYNIYAISSSGSDLIISNSNIESSLICIYSSNKFEINSSELKCGTVGIDARLSNPSLIDDVVIDAKTGINLYSGMINFNSGTINAIDYGVKQSSGTALLIGVKDGVINSSPQINSENYGVYNEDCVSLFYDGVIKAKTAVFIQEFNEYENNSMTVYSYEGDNDEYTVFRII